MTAMHTGNKNFLHYASMEELHKDNLKWLREISTWKTDIDRLYFYVIEIKLNQTVFPVKGLYHLEKKILHHITTNELDSFNQLITEHECQLAEKQWKEKKEEEARYRQQHLQISCRYRLFKSSMKLLRREVQHLGRRRSLSFAQRPF